MSPHLYPFVSGLAVMAVLVAAAAYVSPMARCTSERGTVWVSAPANRCLPITQFMPAGALEAAR